jgi:hypothetical protein
MRGPFDARISLRLKSGFARDDAATGEFKLIGAAYI